MNNNNNGNKGKESDIITKKGFLISLPGKKNAPDTQSSINLAKPKGEAVQKTGSSEGAEKKGFEKKNNKHGKNRFNKNNNHTDNKNVAENKPEAKNNNIPEKENKNFAAPSENKHEKHDRRRDKNKKGKKEKFAQNSNNNNNNNNNNNKNSDNNKVNQEKHFDNHKKNRHEAKQKHGDFSNVSASVPAEEIKSFAAVNAEKTFETRELSLEEKYKNAKPLAEQIAEQEMRQKGIKIPYDSDNTPKEVEKQEIVGIRFREAGKIYYFDPAGVKVPFGAPVIVETARGSEYGFTAISNRMIPVDSLTAPLKKLERLATTMDTQKHEANKALEKDAEKVFLEKVEKLGLPMNLIYVEYTFDNSRLLFYFTAETRIDFRELVKELAGVFRTRIELRQIGVRDEAKMLGGMGVCGRATCCNTFLGDFAQVSIKMAKDQSLSLNAAKISGACGKLMCCLRYEDKVYEEENARTPKVGSIVETSEGKGVVVERNALKGIVNVQLDTSPEAPAKPFPREEVMVIGFNKSKSDDDIDSEELKKLQDS